MLLPKSIYREAYAVVRFFGESLDPLVLTLALRLPGDHTHRAGEPRLSRTKTGKILEGAVYENGMWTMSSAAWVSSTKLTTHIEWLLGQLEPRAQDVRSLLSAGISGDIFAFSSGSTSVPPAVPRQMRQRALALGLRIDIDHYEVASSA